MIKIILILSPATLGLLTDQKAEELSEKLVPVVEKSFDIKRDNNTSATVIRATSVYGEADIQIFINFHIGSHEYGYEYFNPIERNIEQLVELIQNEYISFFKEKGIKPYAFSVECVPLKGAFYKLFDIDEELE